MTLMSACVAVERLQTLRNHLPKLKHHQGDLHIDKVVLWKNNFKVIFILFIYDPILKKYIVNLGLLSCYRDGILIAEKK